MKLIEPTARSRKDFFQFGVLTSGTILIAAVFLFFHGFYWAAAFEFAGFSAMCWQLGKIQGWKRRNGGW